MKKGELLFIKKGFTIIELIVVIAIIAVLASIVLVNVVGVMESGKVSVAGTIQRTMTQAMILYYADMGFYPPDVNRGCDPDFAQPLPLNPSNPAPGNAYYCPPPDQITCDHCPLNWQAIVTQNWRGPYIATWPQKTPWGGVYDYNYWDAADNIRYGCNIPPGLYAGVERNYDNITGAIPDSAQQKMTNYGFNIDCILSGEAQMLLQPL